MRVPQRIASTLTRTGWNPRTIRLGSRLHTFLFRTLGLGRFRLVGSDSLILTTVGRKSGRETSTPLFYAAEGSRIYVAASFAGSGTPPQWYRNLMECAEVTIERGNTKGRYRARTVDDTEAARIWPLLDAVYPTFAKYRARAARVIPVIELVPIG